MDDEGCFWQLCSSKFAFMHMKDHISPKQFPYFLQAEMFFKKYKKLRKNSIHSKFQKQILNFHASLAVVALFLLLL